VNDYYLSDSNLSPTWTFEAINHSRRKNSLDSTMSVKGSDGETVQH